MDNPEEQKINYLEIGNIFNKCFSKARKEITKKYKSGKNHNLINDLSISFSQWTI